MADLLQVDGIHTAYGLSQVLFGVSLDVRAGECVALIGRNGVGKTTTMRSIMGLTPPSSGRVMWKDRDIAHLGPHRICRLGIGFVPEDRRIFPELTVWENLDIARRAGGGGKSTWQEDQVFALFPDLEEMQDYLQANAWQPIDLWPAGNQEILHKKGRVDANGRVHLVARGDQIVPMVCGGLGSLHAVALPSFGESQMQSHAVLRP